MSARVIRVAGAHDLPAFVAIYNEAVADRFATADLDPVTVGDRAAWLEAHDPKIHPIYVCERDGEVVGYCSLSVYRGGRAAVRRTAEISYYVARSARRQGIGRALVEHATREAPVLGFRVLFAIVLDRNAASIGLMEATGFSLWGRLPAVAEIEGQIVDHLYYGRLI